MGVFEQWKAGATIQFLSKMTGKWTDCAYNKPKWDKTTKYRVKPQVEYVYKRHYVACIAPAEHWNPGVMRYEGNGMFSRHGTNAEIHISKLAWVNQEPIPLDKE